jgi:hypothetical protein
MAPQRICLTPTRNEAWIIKPFLSAALSWADRVIVADQGSTDGTLEVLQNTLKVEPVINDSPVYDEAYRQKLLIGRARQSGEGRILIALDADEVLSANSIHSKEWDLINDAKPGTVLRFRWVNILPGFEQAWIPDERKRCGFIDDGSSHSGQKIHSQRIPGGSDAPVLDLHEIVVLHFQYVVWERMERKHRWYQAWEHLEHPEKGPLQIYRQYNHMHGSWDKHEICDFQPEWLESYERSGIDFRSLACEPVTWWDKEVAKLISEHGPAQFRKLAIWDQDWNTMAAQIGLKHRDMSDPRSVGEKIIHRLLAATQENRGNIGVRALERFLRLRGW